MFRRVGGGEQIKRGVIHSDKAPGSTLGAALLLEEVRNMMRRFGRYAAVIATTVALAVTTLAVLASSALAIAPLPYAPGSGGFDAIDGLMVGIGLAVVAASLAYVAVTIRRDRLVGDVVELPTTSVTGESERKKAA
jgi:hypothetical protein